jgi:hypothetical protein
LRQPADRKQHRQKQQAQRVSAKRSPCNRWLGDGNQGALGREGTDFPVAIILRSSSTACSLFGSVILSLLAIGHSVVAFIILY